ncbi:hypothetical protein EVAR_83157_1 [Eumeta japonica]|uniref:Endonuclease/exonuclease/phosphatase domain-containing protein n=1 Tax=Eumeta variegata TaxID=151549 RepID=A0A4C1YDX5_EUMVA|nr:hypothetical protein EVAR_83157_1 [Eumeta japonica]
MCARVQSRHNYGAGNSPTTTLIKRLQNKKFRSTTDRQGAPKGGTALYYNRSLYCCPIDTPPLVNIEATACRLSMTGHDILILVSIYLPPRKKLLRSYLEALFALEDAVILFGDFNSKSTNWNCNYTNSNGRKMEAFAEDIHSISFPHFHQLTITITTTTGRIS